MNKSQSLVRLLQLASPMLPVGAYSYSQGLEWGIESGEVHDLVSAQAWIGDVLQVYQGGFELPVLSRFYRAWQSGDADALNDWNAFYLAGRDNAEALAESRQMGYSLKRLLLEFDDLPDAWTMMMEALPSASFPALYAGISQAWGIDEQDALQAYAWSWLENQVSAAMKAVPLGQVAGQKILLSVADSISVLVEEAMHLPDFMISNFCPILTIAGCRHETQYSRLFRS
ncbi:urease accessory protein [Methylobacillus rhizosphaerae]|uniref:Urease accessory protein UreF n=1 Tax=Methylobacillus rhizosphaerae TaxID=551994 RepID=A0A238YGT6_9PROT|nr:urease accessory protein UreF [Methylobacillus rhizosphaerae]SNR69589.1 urease accessory protein [Methylobacillus rhizosphaerae]